MAFVETPHLRWPFRVEAGRFQVVEQDTIDDVAQCVHVLMRTPAGWRPLAPEVGVVDPLWRDRFEVDRVAAGLAEWEPRAVLQTTTTGPDGDGKQGVTINVDLAGA